MNISIRIQITLSAIMLQTLPHENNPIIQFTTLVVQHGFRSLSHNSDGAVCAVFQVKLAIISLVREPWRSNHQYVITA